MNFKYNNIEFDFLYTFNNIEVMAKYDKAEKALNVILVEQETNTDIVDRITVCTKAMTVFIDEVLGDTACNTIFGEKAQTAEIMKVKNSIILYVAERMRAENTAVQQNEN